MIETIKKRAGIDYLITVAVTTNEQAKPLADRDIMLIVHTPYITDEIITYSIIEGNKLRFYFRRMKEGEYTFSILENWKKERGATAIDIPIAIDLVSRTWEESDQQPSTFEVEQIDLGVVDLVIGGGFGKPMTKEQIEKILTGDISTHNHDTQTKNLLKDYVKKEGGKGLSTNDFSKEYKDIVDNLKDVSGSIKAANEATTAATAAAQKATEVVNTMPHAEIVGASKVVTF